MARKKVVWTHLRYEKVHIGLPQNRALLVAYSGKLKSDSAFHLIFQLLTVYFR